MSINTPIGLKDYPGVATCYHSFKLRYYYDCAISNTYWTSPTFDIPVALFVGGGGVSYDFRVENTLNTAEDPDHCSGGYECGLDSRANGMSFDVPYDLMTFASDGVEPFNNWTLTFGDPSTDDVGILAIRIECWMIDYIPRAIHAGNKFSNDFTLEIIDLQMTVPSLEIGLDSDLTI